MRHTITMKQLFAFILISLYTIVQAHAQLLTDNPLKGRLDSVVQKIADAYMQQPRAVGLSIGIYDNGVSQIYNYGESVKGSRVLINANQFFNLGSVAKTFVGTMLAEAVIEKRTKLDDDIRR